MRRVPLAPRFGRWLLAVALGGSGSASAADRLQLPPGEPDAPWEVPVQLAGLELGPNGGTGTCVRIVPQSGGWVLRATAADGTVRVATVEPPVTAAEREDVAFLARSLVRTLAVGTAPAPRTAGVPTGVSPVSLPPPPVPRPPPPPVSAAREADVAVAEAPEPEPTAESLPSTLPEPEAPAEPEPELEWEHVEVLTDGAPPPPPGFAEAVPVRRRQRGRIVLPPMRFRNAVLVRAGHDVGGAVSYGIDVVEIGRTRLGWELAWNPSHGIGLPLARQVNAADVTARASTAIGTRLSLGPVVGVSYRTWRQQFQPIETGLTPTLGGEVDVALVTVGRWSFGLDARATLDLSRTDLVLETGAVSTFTPATVQSGLAIRFAGSRDPSRRHRTSSR